MVIQLNLTVISVTPNIVPILISIFYVLYYYARNNNDTDNKLLYWICM